MENEAVQTDAAKKISGVSQIAIKVEGVSEKFRLYHDKGSTLKEALVRLRRARSYEDFWALKDVSFEVKKGEVFGIIGENGSGKSTLLKCISKILTPTKGSITLDGRVSALLEVGAGFHQELTGRENMYLNGTILGLSRKEITRRFDKIVSFAELEQFIDMPVRNYSSGMYIRLGFAIAINVDPDILLIDEVLAVGDASFQDKCKEKIDEIRSQGKTILLVSHNLDDVRRICDRVLCLEKGEAVATGSTDETVDFYIDRVRNKQEMELRTLNKAAAADTNLLDANASSGGSRRGSMEVEITGVRLLDSKSDEKYIYKSGESMTVSIEYRAHAKIEHPKFGLEFFRADGLPVCGMNTDYAGVELGPVEGVGTIEYRIPDLLLLEGAYSLTVAAYTTKFDQIHNYDYHEKLYHFKVIPGTYTIPCGVIHLPATWQDGKNP